MSVVTRIAPSPTGYLHFGLARTALFSYLYAKKNGGEYIMRIEDTDTARNKPEFEADIVDQFQWLGLTPDRSYRQSDNVERHKECLADLIKRDTAYISKEPAKDDPTQVVEVVRLRNPGEQVTFKDLIRGDIVFDTSELKDFVIARSVNEPLFHFAVVVDDHDEGVTHVIRGEDHISNTPRHMLILRALGFKIPAYAHLPLILMPDKSKMSKRKHETSVKHFRESGIVPQALINYVALMGWTPPSGKEILSVDEMIQEFELEKLHSSGAIFDYEKLRWYNREYLLKRNDAELASYVLPVLEKALKERGISWDAGIAEKIVSLLKERISVAADISESVAKGEVDFFFADPTLDVARVPQKGVSTEETKSHLEALAKLLSEATEGDYGDPERLKGLIWPYATEKGRGAVLWPFRYALTGLERSPDPFVVASVVGKETTLRRVLKAVAFL